jgi:CHRD domain
MRMETVIALSIFSLAAAQSAFAQDDRGFNRLGASLVGYEETPSISTTGNGRFDAQIRNDDSEIVYQLSYDALEGNVQQAHIHLGQPGVAGGIVVFLCTNLGNGPAGLQGSQPCPPPPATITGRITAVDMTPNPGAVTQGIAPNEFAELVRAIRAGATYVNVHSDKWPAGEIRDQIGRGSSQSHH